MPTVSIIIPVYNAEERIRACIESVLTQEYQDFELIVMDDGSTDGSPAILDELAATDPRMTVIHKQNSGVSDTRNQALDRAQGTYIQFLDADDRIPSDSTKLLVRAMEDDSPEALSAEEQNPEKQAEPGTCDMVIGDFYRVVGTHVSKKGSIDDEGLITRKKFGDYMMYAPSDFYFGVLWNKLFRRSIIERYQIRMDPDMSWCEDFIFNMEYELHCRAVYVLRAPVYYYVKSENSLVSQGASLSRTVRMKLNVIEYYDNFYRRMYEDSKTGYYIRKPVIYSFLMNFARDDVLVPGLPGTYRVGEEGVHVTFHDDFRKCFATDNYYRGKLLDRFLNTAALKHGLELRDMKVLLYVKVAGRDAARAEVADFIGETPHAAASSIGRLLRKGYLVKTKEPGAVPDSDSDYEDELPEESGNETADSTATPGSTVTAKPKRVLKLRLAEENAEAREVSNEIDEVLEDSRQALLAGLSEEEKKEAERLSGKLRENVIRALL